MSSYVVDSSAILAALLSERGGDQAVREMGDDSILSTVNLVEVIAILQDHNWPEGEIEAALDRAPYSLESLSEAQALDAGFLRNLTRKNGLSLGDRACLALARERRLPALTADRAWAGLDVGIEIRLIR